MDERKPAAYVMGLQGQGKFRSAETYANCVDQTSACFMLLLLQRISSSMARMSQTPLPKRPHRNKVSSSILTKPSMNGGSNTNTNRLFLPVMSSQSSQQCKATPNHHASGRSMPTKSYVRLDLPQRSTNHAFTPAQSTVNKSYSCNKLTTLLLQLRTNAPQKFLWTSLTTNSKSPSKGRVTWICTTEWTFNILDTISSCWSKPL